MCMIELHVSLNQSWKQGLRLEISMIPQEEHERTLEKEHEISPVSENSMIFPSDLEAQALKLEFELN